MCPPDYYGIEYEINPWMDRRRQVDRELAVKQWNDLRAILEGMGAKISQLQPAPGLPDMVFTANAGLIYGDRAIVSRFRPYQRRGEEVHDAAWFRGQGLQVEWLPEDVYFEGAGDALFCGETLIAGYRQRSDALSQQRVGDMLGCRVIPVELVDAYYYHLDTCFCPLTPGLAIYNPAAFDEYGHHVLREVVEQLIELSDDEARSFAANAVVVGTNVVTNIGCPRLHLQLKAQGFSPVATPLSEFVKAGGSAKCLTLRVDGEEAASWKYAS
jgi:N-dimethylarginine dimethylaminohydrolase